MSEEFSATNSAILYNLFSADPDEQLVERGALSEEEIGQITEVMTALAQLRQVDDDLFEASQRYMKLGRTDMQAIRFLIVAHNMGTAVTAGAIAAHLRISTASTTKLLDRLEHGGHITREPHPTDRRAIVIEVTPETMRTAMLTVGRQHAKRLHAAARLSPEERRVVVRFLTDMAQEIALTDGEWHEATPEH